MAKESVSEGEGRDGSDNDENGDTVQEGVDDETIKPKERVR